MKSIRMLTIGMTLLVGAATQTASAQPTDYSQAYKQALRTNPGVGLNTNRYLYDRYYRGNPAVSPYVSGALLGGNDAGTAYYAVTRKDLQARQANAKAQAGYVQQRKLQGNVGYTANPGAGYLGGPAPTGRKPVPNTTPGAYHNHWYGNWAR